MRVSERDLGPILRFLDETLSEPSIEPFPPSTLRALASLIPADQVDYFERRGTGGRAVAFTMAYAETEQSWVDSVVRSFGHQNPLGPFKWTPADGPIRLSAVISKEKLQQLDYFREFLVPEHIRDRLRVWLDRSADSATCVTFTRSTADFSARDAAVLSILQPHLVTYRERGLTAAESTMLPDANPLTLREAQVLTLAASGRPNREIAEALFITPATVAKHLERAYRKLDVHSRPELMARLRSPASTASNHSPERA
jgi:DNA-binding CsgD family transcriptional regulator